MNESEMSQNQRQLDEPSVLWILQLTTQFNLVAVEVFHCCNENFPKSIKQITVIPGSGCGRPNSKLCMHADLKNSIHQRWQQLFKDFMNK